MTNHLDVAHPPPPFRSRAAFTLLTLFLLTLWMLPAAAQDTTIITLGIPDGMQTLLYDTILARFEEANPGVQVEIVPVTFGVPVMLNSTNLSEYLETGKNYVQRADVLFVGQTNLSPELTRAGFFLNLAPLINSDTSLNPDDFYPSVRDAFTWDGGQWALPVAADTVLTVYDSQVFDAAGLAYPGGGWTLADFANAARQLAVYEDSQVTRPGLLVSTFDLPVFLRSLLGKDFSPAADTPEFATPELTQLLVDWNALVAEGVASTDAALQNIPLQIGRRYLLSEVTNALRRDNLPKAALLPGDSAGVDPYGFAVSAGTVYPDAAYALVKFLSQEPALSAIYGGGSPARQTMLPGESADVITYPPDTQAVLDEAMWVGFPTTTLHYRGYIMDALAAVGTGQDPLTALQNAQVAAADDVNIALAQVGTTILSVATPVIEPPVTDGVVLNFALWTGGTSFENEGLWRAVVDEFMAADPQVGQINLNFVMPTSANWRQGVEAANDCFYSPWNEVTSIDKSLILNLDPLLDADPNFDLADVVGGVLPLVQADNATWAVPISVTSYVLRYNAQALTDAGVSLPPPEGWDINQFVDALETLQSGLGDTPAFYPEEFNGNFLLMLIAAYGGLPIDYRTTPPTINFTDPAIVDAIRQVLDLAKNKRLSYEEMGRVIRMFSTSPPGDARVIYGDSLQFPSDGTRESITPFPHGGAYTPVTLDVTTAFISAHTLYPEACYRWISTFAHHPELFIGMPAFRSLINSEALAARDPSTLATYQQLDGVLSAEGAVVFPAEIDTRFWLLRAFDNYVLHGADLVAELTNAEVLTNAYLGCLAGGGDVPTCAVQTDPALAERYGG